MRLIDADSLKYRRKDYGGHDDVSFEKRKAGIMFLLKEDIDNAPTIEPKKGRCTNESIYFHCSVCDYGVQDVFEGSYKQETKTT